MRQGEAMEGKGRGRGRRMMKEIRSRGRGREWERSWEREGRGKGRWGRRMDYRLLGQGSKVSTIKSPWPAGRARSVRAKNVCSPLFFHLPYSD